LRTHPNDIYDGYLGGNYDAWYTAPSMAEKLAHIATDLHAYPWEPGTVVRYRDQDFYLLGLALEEFLKSVRGPQADLWNMLKEEVFLPIGIHHAPAVRTREPGDREGVVWANAGYYPTLDDLTKIARLYQNLGAHHGVQLLHRGLTSELMAATGAIPKQTDQAGPREAVGADGAPLEAYKMGFHFTPYIGRVDRRAYLFPTMSGSGENELILFPQGTISLRIAKAAQLPEGEKSSSDAGPQTILAVERMKIF
jgi:CubicO group peptidase (beta-lactamase class C family)